MKRKKRAFTLVELLIVVGVIAILIALLIPALAAVRTMVKETQQKAQLTTVEIALTAFKNDYGGYPPSDCTDDGAPAPPANAEYCGVQKLAEALIGWDAMGFHPKSAWREDGEGQNTRDETYDPDKNRDTNPADGTLDTLKERNRTYLELATANAFQLGDLFNNTGKLEPNTFVLCDVFGRKSVPVGGKLVKAGAPILYYRANTSSKTLDYANIAFEKLIYNCLDNEGFVVYVKEPADQAQYPSHTTPVNPLADVSNNRRAFYEYIKDPKVTNVTTVDWPYRPDSYILISAGADGLYGTNDDIRNF